MRMVVLPSLVCVWLILLRNHTLRKLMLGELKYVTQDALIQLATADLYPNGP